MNHLFIDSFVSVFLAMAQIFIILIIAGFLVKKKIINQEHIQSLSQVTVYVFLPSLIFANVLQKFHPKEMPYWWFIPLVAIVMIFIGLGINSLFFLRRMKEKQNLLPLGSMQNAGYLVLPLGQLLYPNQFEEFSLYVFLYILGFNPILWSVGKVLISSDSTKNEKLKWNSFISPPGVLTLLSIIIVLLGLDRFIPNTVVSATNLLGQAAIPVATFVLGATLGSMKIKANFSFYELSASLLTKFIFLPIIVFTIISIINLKTTNPLLANFFMIEASVAPATAIILMLRAYGGDVNKIGAMVFVSYLVSLIASPMWMALWNIF